MKIAIVFCATGKYTHASIPQARRILACINIVREEYAKVDRRPYFKVIMVGDASPECEAVRAFYAKSLESPWVEFEFIEFQAGNNTSEEKHADGQRGLREDACLRIAQMRTLLHDAATRFNADFTWSLDSDVLPPDNALICSLDMLKFDSGYYSIAFCPYPAQGGGAYLGGRGTPQAPILPDIYPEEREIPPELQARMDAHQSAVRGAEWDAEHEAIREEIEKCPAKGNIFALSAIGWRRRGWLDAAYPAIGLGAVLPSDWCGFGCTLMSKRALLNATFEGYDGKGTEDLYVVYKRWMPAGLKICVIPHCPCSHVITDRGGYDGKKVMQHAYHETQGEAIGHLRVEPRPWYACAEGETYLPENDGKLIRG